MYCLSSTSLLANSRPRFVAEARITVVRTGPIAPPIILIIFEVTEPILVYSLGVNATVLNYINAQKDWLTVIHLPKKAPYLNPND